MRRIISTFFLLAVIMVMVFGSMGSVEAFQNVKIQQGGKLVTDFDQNGVYDPYYVKAVGYSPYEIGSFPTQWGPCWYTGTVGGQPQFSCPGAGVFENENVLSRDLNLIKQLNANTIRTWDKVSSRLLDDANSRGIKVIAGYWIPHNLDYLNGDLSMVRNDFLNYVQTFQNHPAILIWGLSNENETELCSFPGAQNGCDRTQQAAAFYNFINSLAQQVKVIEGNNFHPVMLVSADLGDIGKIATDQMLSNIDIHGCNVYRGAILGTDVNNFFTQYSQRSSKPVLITEFGNDAWSVQDATNPSVGQERQDLQSSYILSQWNTIRFNKAVGGVVLEYSDEWWKDTMGTFGWTPESANHNYGYGRLPDGTVFNAGQPDGYANDEWWGITSRTKNSIEGGVDVITPRRAYYDLQHQFGNFLYPSSTNVQITMKKDNIFYLTKMNAFKIRSEILSGWMLYNNQDGVYTPVGGTPTPTVVQGFGFYQSSGGIAAGGETTIEAYVNNNKSYGTYEGSYTLKGVKNGIWVVIDTIRYRIQFLAQ